MLTGGTTVAIQTSATIAGKVTIIAGKTISGVLGVAGIILLPITAIAGSIWSYKNVKNEIKDNIIENKQNFSKKHFGN